MCTKCFKKNGEIVGSIPDLISPSYQFEAETTNIHQFAEVLGGPRGRQQRH